MSANRSRPSLALLVALLAALPGSPSHADDGLPVTTLIGLSLPSRARAAAWTSLAGPLWSKSGPSPDDVFQGDLDDCALLARMIGLAAHRPEQLMHSLVERPDGRIAVTLFPPPSRAKVELLVDRRVPTKDGRPLFAGTSAPAFASDLAREFAASGTRPIWPAILEKAVAALYGGYAALDGERIDQRAALDGSREFTIWLPDAPPAASASALREALALGLSVELGNADPERAHAAGVRPAHAYAVLGAREVDGVFRLQLREPLGANEATSNAGVTELGGSDALSLFRWMGIGGGDWSSMKSLAALPGKPGIRDGSR